ncbi:MAG: type I restriction enzyme HsdR N-terminal domain-containing protein, partial [Verrucomicrobia bacterium]|nr:type I restriction enzyme HsdR N-terminal domain-containing protein [Verrucomicrobiota bacterium]
LHRLGYTDDDRYDDMPVSAAHGSKPTRLTVDCALFNVEIEGLKNQVLLTVEAKKEDRLQKPVELQKAKNQVKSYALWTGCYFGLVTDSRVLEVYRIGRLHTEQDETLFSCRREELPVRFPELFSRVSKTTLTDFYLRTIGVTEEIGG